MNTTQTETTAPVVSDETIIAYAKAQGFSRDITITRGAGLYDFVRVSGWTASTHCWSFMDLKAETFAPAPAPATIRINGRDFTVATTPGKEGVRYLLTGKRGAQYGTMRNRNNPAMMFIINLRGFGIAPSFEGVWLTDEGGALRTVR